MEDTLKFNELKALKEQQNKMLVNEVLKRQMTEEKERKIQELIDRKTNVTGQATFGPKETEETLIFQHLKKQSDMENLRKNLNEQIEYDLQGEQAKYHKAIEMEKFNVEQT